MNAKDQNNKRQDQGFIQTKVSDKVDFFNKFAENRRNALSVKSKSLETVFPSLRERLDSLQNPGGGHHTITAYKSVSNLDRSHTLCYRDQPTPPYNQAAHTLTRHDSGFDSTLNVNNTGDGQNLSRSLLNIAFLSGAPTENVGPYGHSGEPYDRDKVTQTMTGNASCSSNKDEYNSNHNVNKVNGSSHLPSLNASESKPVQGNSKQLVERKTLNLKIAENKDQAISSPVRNPGTGCYSQTYKSPTRKQLSRSIASFPPVLESPEEENCEKLKDVDNFETSKGNVQISSLQSKSDSHLQRINAEVDPSRFPVYHHITDSQVLIGGSANNLTHSSGALTCPTTSTDQLNQSRIIIEHTQETLDEFVKDDKICKAGLEDFELRRFKNAKNILDKTGLLIIKCGDKDGSTHLGYSLMVASNSSTKCIIGNTSEYSVCIAGGCESYTMLVDNAEMCGQDLNNWISHLERNATKRQKGTLKLIFIVKERIEQYGTGLSHRFEGSVLDLSLPKNSVNAEERAHLLRRCVNRKNRDRRKAIIDLKDSEIDQICRSATSFEYFGLIGRFLSHADNIKQGVEFFHVPSTGLYRRIHLMKTSNIETEKCMYIALGAVYFFKGSLYKDNITMLSRRMSADMSQPRSNIRNSSELLNCSSNSRRRSKSTNQTQIDASSYERLMDLASELKFVSSLGKRINDGIKLLNGTFLCEDTLNSRFIFSSQSIENAIAISIGQDYPKEIIAHCTKEFFHVYIGTDMSYQVDEERCIRIDIETKESCEIAIERLRQALVEEDFEYFISHPLIRDGKFFEILSEKWNEKNLYERVVGFFWSSKRKCFAETLMNMKDKMGKSVLIYALDYPFIEVSMTEDIRSLADWVVCHKKWLEYRNVHKQDALQVEDKVIEHSCEEKLESVYLNLVERLGINRDRFKTKWLFAAVRSGSKAIVHDILDVNANFPEDIYHQALENALSVLVQEPTTERKEVLWELSRKTESGISSLLLSIGKSGCGRSLAAVQTAFKLDISVSKLTQEGPMLFVLIKYNRLALFKMLLLEPFLANLRMKYRGQLCVHKAAQIGRLSFLQHICERDKGMALEGNVDGRTPLHLASQNGHKNCVLFLLAVGVNVNAMDHSGQTALHKAASRLDAQIVHILVKRGAADVYAKDRGRKTAIDIARQCKNEKAVSIMIGRPKKLILPDTQLNDVRLLFK